MSVKSFLGGLLMVVGGLMAALCGLCTVAVVLEGFFGPRGELLTGPDLAIVGLFVGGIPTLIGLGIFLIGRALRRPARP